MLTRPAVSRAKAYLKVRHKAVRDAMKQLSLDGLLVTHPADLAYLTNFTGEKAIGLITEKSFHLVTDFRNREQAELQAGWLAINVCEGNSAPTVAKVLSDAKLARIGFEANFTAFGQIDAIDRGVKELHKGASNGKAHEVQLVPVDDVMANIRKVKDDNEIELIRKSVEISEQAFDAVRPEITVGQTENWIAGQLIAELRSRGASAASMTPIVAAGLNSSQPGYRPGEHDTALVKDIPLLLNWGAVYRGYCSDLTRTLLIGRPDAKIKEIYKVVLEAHNAAIAFLRPGVTTAEADRVARDVIERAGYGKEFGHGLGHGIGREVDELPRLSRWAAEEELYPGMIITVEPGIYLPGVGGVRIEDDVLITHSSSEVLSNLDRSFEGCHIE